MYEWTSVWIIGPTCEPMNGPMDRASGPMNGPMDQLGRPCCAGAIACVKFPNHVVKGDEDDADADASALEADIEGAKKAGGRRLFTRNTCFRRSTYGSTRGEIRCFLSVVDDKTDELRRLLTCGGV